MVFSDWYEEWGKGGRGGGKTGGGGIKGEEGKVLRRTGKKYNCSRPPEICPEWSASILCGTRLFPAGAFGAIAGRNKRAIESGIDSKLRRCHYNSATWPV